MIQPGPGFSLAGGRHAHSRRGQAGTLQGREDAADVRCKPQHPERGALWAGARPGGGLCFLLQAGGVLGVLCTQLSCMLPAALRFLQPSTLTWVRNLRLACSALDQTRYKQALNGHKLGTYSRDTLQIPNRGQNP